MTVKDVSRKFAISKNTIYKHLKRGTIKAKRHPLNRKWMIPKSVIEKLIQDMEPED